MPFIPFVRTNPDIVQRPKLSDNATHSELLDHVLIVRTQRAASANSKGISRDLVAHYVDNWRFETMKEYRERIGE